MVIGIANQPMRNNNTVHPSMSLALIFEEFYRFRRDFRADDRHHQVLLPVRMVTLIESLLRARKKMALPAYPPARKISLRVEMLVEVFSRADRGWADSRDYDSILRSSFHVDERGEIEVKVCELGGLISKACARPWPELRSEIIAASHNFQSTYSIKSYDCKIFERTKFEEDDYREMFDARHRTVHGPVKQEIDADKWMDMTERLFESVFADNPGMFSLWKGAALLELDENHEALKLLRHAAPKLNYGWAFYYLGRALYEDGDKNGARNAFQKAVRHADTQYNITYVAPEARDDPVGTDWVRLDAALLAYRTGEEMQRFDEDNAVICFRMAVNMSGDNSYLYSGIASYLMCISPKDALWCLNTGIRKIKKYCWDKELAGLYYDKGHCLWLMGRDSVAKSWFAKALKIQPDFEEARKGLDRSKGKPDEPVRV